MSSERFQFEEAKRINPFGVTVWHEFSPLANKFNSANLGQGFPNWKPPEFVVEAVKQAADHKTGDQPNLINQYARSAGHMRLVNILAQKYSPLLSRQIDPATMICVTAGASEGCFACIQSVVNPGDEVILIEPFFDIYLGGIIIAGGIPKYVSLKPTKPIPTHASDFVLDLNELKAAITDKTKLIMLNTPHNPTGKVFTKEELEGIANVIRGHPNCFVLSDEVYEHLVYDGAVFTRFATLPGMFERTFSVSSAGKLFSVTGWKIGWVIAPPNLISAVGRVHQFVTFSIATPLQEAIAIALETAPQHNHYENLLQMYLNKRDFLFKVLQECGLNPILPQGSFFIIADASTIKLIGDEGRQSSKSITSLFFDRNDWNICRWLTTDVGVTAIPCSAFYAEYNAIKSENQRYIRFAFCKTDDSLKAAAASIKKLIQILNERK